MVDCVGDAHHENDEHNLGVRLKFFREQNGLSQRELAKRAGVPHSSISMIEQGLSSPSVNSLVKILSGIPLDISHFFACDLATYSEVTFSASVLAQSQKQLFADVFVQSIPLLQPRYRAAEFQRFEMMPNSDTGLTPQVSTESFSGYLAQGYRQADKVPTR